MEKKLYNTDFIVPDFMKKGYRVNMPTRKKRLCRYDLFREFFIKLEDRKMKKVTHTHEDYNWEDSCRPLQQKHFRNLKKQPLQPLSQIKRTSTQRFYNVQHENISKEQIENAKKLELLKLEEDILRYFCVGNQDGQNFYFEQEKTYDGAPTVSVSKTYQYFTFYNHDFAELKEKLEAVGIEFMASYPLNSEVGLIKAKRK